MHLDTPLTSEKTSKLKAGDKILLSGIIYTARDSAHKKLIEMLNNGEKLPFDIKNSIVYYVGPSPTPPGKAIGSAGPTTSYRMDPYAHTLMDLGLKGMIGKGARNQEVINSIIKNKAIYFTCIGGTAALLSSHIISSEIIAFEELGPEAIRKLEIKDFPLFVTIDAFGKNIYNQT